MLICRRYVVTVIWGGNLMYNNEFLSVQGNLNFRVGNHRTAILRTSERKDGFDF
jgi:hypothetical protein